MPRDAETLGQRLRLARKKRRLSQDDLADLSGMRQPDISKIELGHIEKTTGIARLADAMRVSAAWLEGRHDAEPDWDAEEIASTVFSRSPTAIDNANEIVPRRRVPLISWVRAGQLADVDDPFHPGDADEWHDVYDTMPGESAFALRVDGDSMTSPHPGAQSFPNGTIIVVDPSRGVDANCYVVAKDVTTQRATFKQLVTDGGRWFLKPLNPAYPTVEIDDPAVRVIGRVIEWRRGGKL